MTKEGHLAVFVALSSVRVRPSVRSRIAVLIDAVPPRVNVMNSATAMLSLFLIYERGEEGACSRWRSRVSDCQTLHPPTANAPLVMHAACSITQEIFLTGQHELIDVSSG